jgi:N-acetylneuraminic acid mutarotase
MMRAGGRCGTWLGVGQRSIVLALARSLALGGAVLLALIPLIAQGALEPTRLDWGIPAQMPTARGSQGLVVAAPNGKLYAVGGWNGSYLATVEEYDPATNAWATKQPMPTARESLGLAAAPNGKLYAVGGYNGSYLATVEEYDPATNAWATKQPMPTARHALGLAAAPNGKLYAIGGDVNNTDFGTVEEYDPATNTWTNCGGTPTVTACKPMTTPRDNFGLAAAPNGKLYAIGGEGETDDEHTVEEYDPATNTWTNCGGTPTVTACTPMPTARVFLGLTAAPNGKLYAAGGGVCCVLATVEEYNPATNTWTNCGGTPTVTACTPMPTTRDLFGLAAAPNGKLYAVGGSGNPYLATVDEYDPSFNTWARRFAPSKVNYPPRYGAAVAVLNDKVYVIGGHDGTQATNTTFEYTPATDAWRSLTPIPTRRFAAGAAAVNGKIYVVGGYDGGPLNAFSEFDPAGNGGNGSWRTAPALAEYPAARFWSGVAAGPNGKLYAVGGDTGGALSSTVREYDPVANSWTTRAAMSVPRETLAVAVAGGKLYAIGGQNYGGNGSTSASGPLVSVSTVEAFTFPTAGSPNGSWATAASLPAPRSVLAAVTGPTGKIYALGGSSTTGSPQTPAAEVFEYDPTINTWSGNPKSPAPNQVYRASLPTARDGLGAAVVGDRIFALGGSGVGNGINAFESAILTGVPSVSTGGPYTVQQGGQVQLSATGTDPEGSTLFISWDLNNDLLYETNGPTVGFSAVGRPAGTYTVRAVAWGRAYAVAATTVTVTAPVPCTPRPQVHVTTTRGAAGQLTAVIAAQANAGVTANSLVNVRITKLTNATARINGAAVGEGQTVTLPANAQQATLLVQRATPGQASTVSFAATDACGEWKSFVGGGPGAF